MNGIDLARQLIVTVTIGDIMVRSGKLLLVGHITALDEVDNFHNL
jgi:hypothetical protein